MITLLTAVALTSVLQHSEDASPKAAQAESLKRFAAQGFSIEAPSSDWSIDDGRSTPSGFQVAVSLGSSGGLVAATVLASSVPEGTEAASLLDRGMASLPLRKEYLEHKALEDAVLASQSAPGARIEWQSETAGRLSIVQRYVVSDGRAYLLQVHAPQAEWEKHWPALESCLQSFQLIEPTSDEEAAGAVSRLAAKCGSEADWAKDWDDAMARARGQGRHALVVVHSYPGFDLPDSTAFSTFMDEDVLALVRTRLVPLRLKSGDEAPIRSPEAYGMSGSTFGVALLLVDANGNVLADTPHVDPEACLPWLRAQLALHPEPALAPSHDDPLVEAELRLDRGELELADEVLKGIDAGVEAQQNGRALLLKARLHRLRHEGQEALELLDQARKLRTDDAQSIDCDRALLLFREGRFAEARDLMSAYVEDGEREANPKALVVMGAAAQFLDGVEAAVPWWSRLVKEHPESRWAWEAAIRLDNLALLKGGDPDGALRWPSPDVLTFLEEPLAEEKGAEHVAKAPQEAVRWLSLHQRSDGSWPTSTDLRRSPALPPGEVGMAIDALAANALLRREGEAREVAEAALAFLLGADERRRAVESPVVYMDYTAWAAWAQLELIADLIGEKPETTDVLLAYGERLVGDLQERVRGNGGWSYYLSGDSSGSNAVEQSISFTTAAAAIGLIRAKSAGVAVPQELIDGALDCLEAMRAESGLFAYMLYHPSGKATHNPAPGAAGRGPACELALFLGGRSSEERLAGSLDMFLEHADGLAAEVGKALMHAGVDSQGCHYPLFDYMMAARAVAKLPGDQRGRYRVSLEDLLMRTRLADGSYQDTPIMGRVYGTAAVLLSLEALGKGQ